MKCKLFVVCLSFVFLSGCAGSYVVKDGPTAMVDYVQDMSKEHVFSEETGQPIPEAELKNFWGKRFSSREGKRSSTAVYAYESESFDGPPAILGSTKSESFYKRVQAGVPLNNLYRTQYQTCERSCFKFFYTSSIFTPKVNSRYQVIIEPIYGVKVFEIVDGKRLEVADVAQGPENAKF